MNHFVRHGGQLYAEGVPLARIAKDVGTPTYVYSRATLERHYRVFDAAWSEVDHLVCYAVKACSNLAVLKLLSDLGAGFDIVSAGELYRVVSAGGDPAKVVFSGVGKGAGEIAAALTAGIRCFNVESAAELALINEIASDLSVKAPVSMRINPDVDAATHPYISTGLKHNKFGIPWTEAVAAYREADRLDNIEIVGLDCHIGSQLADTAPLVEAMERLLHLVDQLAAEGIEITHLDVGGGLGITYRDESPPSPDAYAKALIDCLGQRKFTIITEPGRVIAGNAGVLLTRCVLTKSNVDKHFVVVDAGMNDFLRPSLYDAWHAIETVAEARQDTVIYDVVGPVCESGDFFAKDRELPRIESGDLLVVRSAGAYGMAMASNYNSRPRPAEVLVDGDTSWVVRRREGLSDLIRGERIPDGLTDSE